MCISSCFKIIDCLLQIYQFYHIQGAKLEHEIKDHFEECITALAARKAILLTECSQEIKNQSKFTFSLVPPSPSSFL